jgi:squalene-associated FAD-dependent desaturase
MIPSGKTVAIVGGGLAGLSAGCALSEAGFRVTVYERRPYLGGRASSYEHPGTGEIVDNCQHVLLGCCTNLLDLYRRIGVENQIRWYDGLTFIEPGGRRSVIGTSALPAPLHTAPSFLRASALSLADKLSITRAMLALLPRLPQETDQSFLEWLKAHGQTNGAIERFWKVVLVSALNEDLDLTSVRNAALVFRESFLKSPEAGKMGVPSVPLTELYGTAGDYIAARGGRIELRAAVDNIQLSGEPKLCVAGQEITPDYVIMAVPFDTLSRLLAADPVAEPLRAMLSRFETSPITGVHLWFDREITELEHAVLLDRTIQWMFNKSRIQPARAAGFRAGNAGSYLELVISSSKSLIDQSRGDIIDMAVRELADFFPAVREAKVLKGTVIKEVHATYSPRPRSDTHRPGPETAWPAIFLAGDWTATDWPATMESAVRSGYLAAEALCRRTGTSQRFLIGDLPPSGLMRLFQ